jgi:hypothetical protein
VRQGEAENYRPELYVLPNRASRLRETSLAVRERIAAIQEHYPGTGVEERGEKILVTIPEELRISHEAHFAQVARQFFAYLRGEETIPAWEKPNMLAKYYITTEALERSSD